MLNNCPNDPSTVNTSEPETESGPLIDKLPEIPALPVKGKPTDVPLAAANEADTFVNPGIDNTPLALISPDAVIGPLTRRSVAMYAFALILSSPSTPKVITLLLSVEIPLTVIPPPNKLPLALISPDAVILAKVTLLPVIANDAVEEFDTLVSMFVWSAELDAFNCVILALAARSAVPLVICVCKAELEAFN